MRLQSLVVSLVLCVVGLGSAWGGTLSSSPATHDFMDVPVTATVNPTVNVTVTAATGNTEITGFTGVATMGSCTEFTFSTVPLPVTINNPEFITVTWTYNPIDRGNDVCVITPTTGSPSGTGGSFTLSGRGVAPVLNVSPSSLTFANQRWNGGAGQDLTITISNDGDEPITSSNISAVFMAASTNFTIGSFSGLPIAGGATGTLTVNFNPSSQGTKMNTVIISLNNDLASEVDEQVGVSGLGTQSTQTFNPAPPGGLNIGTFDVGSNGMANMVIGNSGSATDTLTLTNARIIGTHASDFSFLDHGCTGQGPCTPTVVNPPIEIGDSETFAIRCAPSAVGTRSATLEITSDDPNGATTNPGNPRTVALSCTGRTPEITVAPTSLAFGTVRVGSPSSQMFTISNATGATSADLTYAVTEMVTDVSITCLPSCMGTLIPGGSATVTVTFQPTATGLRTGNIVVTSSDLDEPTTNVGMSGTGAESNLSSSMSPNFGNVPVAQVGGSVQNATITNNGGISLNTTSMTITGDASFSFAFPSGACQSGTTCNAPGRVVTAAANGGTAVIPIRCDPSSAGPKTATLNIQSDDPSPAGGTDIALNCTGTVSAMTVTPGTLSFANQRINTTSGTMNITISNVGGAAALNYSVTEPVGDQFIVTAGSICNPTCNNLTVPAGMTATITVAFRPTTTGLKTGAVVIDDLDNFASDASVNVSGTGVEPVATLMTATTLAFGNVRINTTSNQAAITVQNTGTMDLTINSVSHTEGQAPEDNFDVAGPGPLGMSTIAMGASQTWNVTCDPEVRGNKTGTVTISNNSTNAPSIAIALTCTSQEGVVQVTAAPFAVAGNPPTINFGFVRLNTSQMTTVTLTNPGNVDVTINSITLGDLSQGFSMTPLGNMTLLANGASPRTFNVVFAPTLDAQGMTTMTIDSMDWNDPVINLVGDGEPTGFACTLDMPYGDVQFDASVPRNITLRNTGTASVNVLGVAFVPGGDLGEFSSLPAGTGLGVLTMGQTRSFAVSAIPTDAMLGARNATIRVTTDLPMGMGQICDVPLTYNSVGPGVTLTPGMTVDFGGVDVDAGPVTMALQLTNSGNGIMDIQTVTQPGGSFTRTDFADTSLSPSQAETIMISFDPSAEGSDTMRETRTFTINTDGLYMGTSQVVPPSILITVTGFGIDRHIAVADVIFPDTYRNPTDAQIPTVTCGVGRDEPCAIRFCNSGAARLDITMIDDPDDAFDLATTSPIMVNGGSMAVPTCTEVAVQFRPTSYNVFTGTVDIVNNDNADPMITVNLMGTGIARPIDVMPNTVPMATIAIGTPVRLSDILASGGLVMHNRATGESFVAEVTAQPNAANVTASLVGDDGTLAGNETRTLDVELIGTQPGPVDVVVAVHLDGDPESHIDINVPLEVVRVDVEGGGCNAGGGGAGAGAAVLLVLLFVAFRSKRSAGVVAILVVAGTARADVSRNIDVGTAPTSTATEPGLFDVDTPDVAPRGSWAFGFAAQHETNPMVARWTDSAMADHQLGLITARTAFAIGFGYAVTDKIELSARLPMYQQKSEARGMGDPFGLDGADGFALGDVGVRAKAQLVKGKVGFAGALDITAPTAKDGQFTGTDLPTAHIQGLIGIKPNRRLSLALNGGFMARQSTQFLLVEQGSELTYGAAIAFRVLDKVALVGEGSGALGVVGAEGKVSPIEASVGLRVRASRSATVGFGGGSGFGRGIGVADMRGFVTVTIAPGGSPIEPVKIIVPPPPRDTRDDDGDGVVNADDACRTDAEDGDGFKDDDGCPDADNDDDGLLDGADQCPLEPEDKDGFQDEDGCADRDNDGDGVNDDDDKCPMEAEDKDGFMDNDGCDEPDNDNDGVPDVLDQCALEPETVNGNNDEDGCPDTGDASVMLMTDRIEVLEPIQFVGTTSKLKPSAAKVLAQVGATMRAERKLKRVRVTVHVHPRGPGDDTLSEKRAEEIRKWLVQWGVEPERIDAKGIGSKRPLVAKSKRGAEEINDRVEFIILERGQ